MNAELIERSLEAVAERVGDPAQIVYARLFEMAPNLKDLFVRDTDGAVRGQMLHQVFEMILDLVGGNHYAEVLIATEWLNHQDLGVPASQFDLFFQAMISSFRDALGPQWTPEIDAAWREVMNRIGEIIARRAVAA
ncbi:MAG TPA: hypothetical protein PK359_16680 [Burkholderiaceae bacterium]|mgnify:CR=1 FL=1|jgi:hemoglobin-like flavoprotein|nr:hypothetical protein [Burkholderiaceae bacterium]